MSSPSVWAPEPSSSIVNHQSPSPITNSNIKLRHQPSPTVNYSIFIHPSHRPSYLDLEPLADALSQVCDIKALALQPRRPVGESVVVAAVEEVEGERFVPRADHLTDARMRDALASWGGGGGERESPPYPTQEGSMGSCRSCGSCRYGRHRCFCC